MGQKSCGFVTFFLTCFSLLGSMVILCIEMKKVKKEEMEGKWKRNEKNQNQNLHQIISYNPDPHINDF